MKQNAYTTQLADGTTVHHGEKPDCRHMLQRHDPNRRARTVKAHTFVCQDCGRTCCWCFGGPDDERCDDCWLKRTISEAGPLTAAPDGVIRTYDPKNPPPRQIHVCRSDFSIQKHTLVAIETHTDANDRILVEFAKYKRDRT